MYQQPGREAGRRVRHAVADSLRPRAHHREVGQIPLLVGDHERFERRAFLVGESGRHRPATESRCDFRRNGRRQVDVDAEKARRRLARHGA